MRTTVFTIALLAASLFIFWPKDKLNSGKDSNIISGTEGIIERKTDLGAEKKSSDIAASLSDDLVSLSDDDDQVIKKLNALESISTNGPARQQLLSWIEANNYNLAGFIERWFRDGKTEDQMLFVARLFHDLKDPEIQLDIASRLLEGEAQGSGLVGTTRFLLENDPEKLFELRDQYPYGMYRTDALRKYMSQNIESIQDVNLRLEKLSQIDPLAHRECARGLGGAIATAINEGRVKDLEISKLPEATRNMIKSHIEK